MNDVLNFTEIKNNIQQANIIINGLLNILNTNNYSKSKIDINILNLDIKYEDSNINNDIVVSNEYIYINNNDIYIIDNDEIVKKEEEK